MSGCALQYRGCVENGHMPSSTRFRLRGKKVTCGTYSTMSFAASDRKWFAATLPCPALPCNLVLEAMLQEGTPFDLGCGLWLQLGGLGGVSGAVYRIGLLEAVSLWVVL